MPTDKQPGNPNEGKNKGEPKDDYARNTAEVNKSVDAWRAMQGLTPIDRSKKARNG